MHLSDGISFELPVRLLLALSRSDLSLLNDALDSGVVACLEELADTSEPSGRCEMSSPLFEGTRLET